eukprot:scaffold4958_cov145-Skeletonema_marinoi.AAC.23
MTKLLLSLIVAALACCAACLEEIDALDEAEKASNGDNNCASASPEQVCIENDDLPVWWDYSIDNLFEDLFNCGEIVYHDTPIPVTDKDVEKVYQQFNELRDKYAKEVNLVPIQQPTPDNSFSLMTVPCEIKDAGGGKGKGLFASEMIKKGSLVMSLNAGNVGIFKDGATWRKFVATLPRETACNFIEWCWIQEIIPEEGNEVDVRNGLTIFCAFDESSLMNAADFDWGYGEEANVRCGSSDDNEEGPCRFDYYATRDIEAGEELTVNYDEFEDPDQHQWVLIGL